MLTTEPIRDVAGNVIEVGDTVVTVNGQATGRVCEVAREDDQTAFVSIRPVFHSYGKGVWYAADQVFWVARPNEAGKTKKKSKKKTENDINPSFDDETRLGDKPGQDRTPTVRSTPARKK